MPNSNDIHDALLARLEELRHNDGIHGWTPQEARNIELLIDLAIAYVNERCPKCGDSGQYWTIIQSDPESKRFEGYKKCDCNRPALLADAANKLGIGGKG